VFLWGFTGIIGALFSENFPTTSVVWYRTFIAAISLLFLLRFSRNIWSIEKKNLFKLLGIGLIVAMHWICFFEAIKVSNVSVTLACFSITSLFTALLEPIFFKRKVIGYEIMLGLVAIAGLYTIFNFESKYYLGIILSVAAAFGASLFTVLNGKLVKTIPSKTISFYELAGGFIWLSVYLLFTGGMTAEALSGTFSDYFYLIILGVVCTAYAFVECIELMKELSPFTVSITVNLEPVYSILLALAIFGEKEKMTPGFYFGALVLLLTVFANVFIKTRQKKRIPPSILG
jgi:drug/metabolite transporter (DMT)-like permease